MLEEMNDGLQPAEGFTSPNESDEFKNQTGNDPIDNNPALTETEKAPVEEKAVEKKRKTATAKKTSPTKTKKNPSTPKEEAPSAPARGRKKKVTTDDELVTTKAVIESQQPDFNEEDALATAQAVEAIAAENAAQAEHEEVTTDWQPSVYEALGMDDLVVKLSEMVTGNQAILAKNQIEEIRRSFMQQFHKLLDEKREAFYQENPDTTQEFSFTLPLKQEFDQLFSAYREQKNAHFKNQQTALDNNLKKRLAIVEEIKQLVNPQESIKDIFKQFTQLREQWKNAGPIPKDKYNHVWNNYHFHVENFYDYLHLDREARDSEFKNNLEQKLKLIARAEKLVEQTDINKAFSELQALHKIWKEEIGPVSREHREQTWQRFSEITRQMHLKREQLLAAQRAVEQDNLTKKQEIIAQIILAGQTEITSHKGWLEQMEKVTVLQQAFFSAGKVPAEVKEETWVSFRDALRKFNVAKNNFYKENKREQNDNLAQKKALVAKAQELEQSTDFATATPLMKKIQEEWRTIGHVPRKLSEPLWVAFRQACNNYFERLKENRNSGTAEQVEAYEMKKAYLEGLRTFELSGKHKEDLEAIKQHIAHWKSLGRVAEGKRQIEGKFNKILDALFEKLNLSKKETEMMRFSTKLEQLAGGESKKLESEKVQLQRKIDEIQSEIFQLENNIQFFASAKKENPMIMEVRKNIDRLKDQLETLKTQKKQIQQIKIES